MQMNYFMSKGWVITVQVVYDKQGQQRAPDLKINSTMDGSPSVDATVYKQNTGEKKTSGALD